MEKKINEPQFLLSPINNEVINYRVYYPKASEKIIMRLIGIAVGGIVGLIFFGGFFKSEGEATVATYISNLVVFFGIGLIVSKILTPTLVQRKKEKRDIVLKSQFRDMLESLSASFSSGSNSNEAFQSAYKDVKQQYGEDSFIAVEIKEILNGIAQNITIDVMLNDFADRSGNEDIKNFADIFNICLEKGGELKSVVRRTSGIISDRMSISDEIETKLASNKMQHNVMSVMPIGIVALLRFSNDSFAATFTTFGGAIVNIIAIGIFIGAYLFGQKICNINK